MIYKAFSKISAGKSSLAARSEARGVFAAEPSAHNSLNQRLRTELCALGHDVSVCIAPDAEAMISAAFREQPDLIIAPMLKIAIPEEVWSRYLCSIVHPGVKGDRGPSSLDWAIARRETTWGVTILEAAPTFDSGAVWATHEFPLETGETPSALRSSGQRAPKVRSKEILAAAEGVSNAKIAARVGSARHEVFEIPPRAAKEPISATAHSSSTCTNSHPPKVPLCNTRSNLANPPPANKPATPCDPLRRRATMAGVSQRIPRHRADGRCPSPYNSGNRLARESRRDSTCHPVVHWE